MKRPLPSILIPSLQNFLAIAVGCLLFAASFPNPLVTEGLPLLAWVAYVPIFWVIRRVTLPGSFFWGALYGYGAFSLFSYWLSAFHPLAGLIVGLIYLILFALLFPLLKLSEYLLPRRYYLLQVLIYLSFEYLRTLGFLGYPYGITGYSQWSLIPVIQIAGIFGVWGVSLLVIFPSAYLAAALGAGNGPAAFIRRERIPGLIYLALLGASLIYGAAAPSDFSGCERVNIALIQHNTDPWRGGIIQYRKNYEVLRSLSLEALAGEPKPDLVAWSETAFVPRIYYHSTYRESPESYLLVRDLLDFLKDQKVPFLIGNDDGRKIVNSEGKWQNIDYNAAILFEGGKILDQYRKLHLVPFTEHFPYRRAFPWVYDMLINADTHMWEQGDEATVFQVRGLKFSTPICFEDTFGYLSRDFVLRGAEFIVNISNDAWSHSLSAQMQHLGMAVFRAVENRVSMARSTASGQTCGIDPRGRILAMAPPFEEAYLTVSLPIYRGESLYTRWGDLLPRLSSALVLLLLMILLSGRIIQGRMNKKAD